MSIHIGSISASLFHPGAPGLLGKLRRSDYSDEVSQFFARLVTSPSEARRLLYIALIDGLVTAGVWQKLDGLFILGAADSATALTNLRKPGSATLQGTAPTFVADRGFTGDGISGYVDTGLNLNTQRYYKRDDCSLFAWSLTNTVDSDAFCAATTARMIPTIVGLFRSRLNDVTNSDLVNLDSSGLFTIARGVAGSYEKYRNATALGTASVASTGVSGTNMRICNDGSVFSVCQIFAAGLGGNLTVGEVSSLHSLLDTYKTAVGA